ncbi:MAG: dihydropteroate synthase, partial [Brevefilum sp.]
MAPNKPPLLWGTRTYLMGIINVTPDSFSGDGLMRDDDVVQAAVTQAKLFLREGADILDIGGESTRPGSKPFNVEEETNRVLPVIKALLTAFPEVRISIDTYKPSVARKALEAGASWVNDIWALRANPELGDVAAEFQTPIILMHNRLKPGSAELEARLGGRYVGTKYDDLLEDIKKDLLESVALAHKKNIPDERIIIDPGIG